VTYQVFRIVPTGFVPDADQATFVIIQAPQGVARLHDGIVRQVEDIVEVDSRDGPDVRRRRLRFTGTAPNQGICFLSLKDSRNARPANRRRRSSAQLFGRFSQITGAQVFPDSAAVDQRSRTFGGFTYELLDQSGGPIEISRRPPSNWSVRRTRHRGSPVCSRSSPPTIRSC
jgi:multidrug efflux pump subunit AcrB